MKQTYSSILGHAENIAARAAATLVEMQGGALAASRKELRDIVTQADLASERIVIEGLRAATPDAGILSEEAGIIGAQGGKRWIVDPLDGTINYAAGLPWFSVTMAYQEDGVTRAGIVDAPLARLKATYEEGVPPRVNGQDARVSAITSLSDAVVSVVLTSHFSPREVARSTEIIRRLGEAARGVRIIVSGGLEMCLVASGKLDAFVSIKADIVSHAAAMPIVRGAGGRITRLDGSEAGDDDAERVASNGHLHTELLACLKGI
jgi:myo-inositol-1(or 4)-monophosphatase